MNYKAADRDLSKLDANFKAKVDLFLKEVEPMGVFVTEAWRSEERQKYLISKGLSKTKISQHQLGLAIDIAFRDDPRTKQVEKELYPEDYEHWYEVFNVARKYEIDWGFDLWRWDKPHFQDNGKILQLNNLSMLSEETQEVLETNFKPRSMSELRRFAVNWDAVEEFNEGTKFLKKPQNLHDLKQVIVLGRLELGK